MKSTMTSKGQITVPAEARRRLGLHAGSRLAFIVRGDDRLEMVRVGGTVRDLKGALPKPRRALSLEEMEAAIGRGAGA